MKFLTKQLFGFALLLITLFALSACQETEMELYSADESVDLQFNYNDSTLIEAISTSEEFNTFFTEYIELVLLTVEQGRSDGEILSNFQAIILSEEISENEKEEAINNFYRSSNQNDIEQQYLSLYRAKENLIVKFPELGDSDISKVETIFTQSVDQWKVSSSRGPLTVLKRFLPGCEPLFLLDGGGTTNEEWLIANCSNWETECQTGFDLCVQSALNELIDDIRLICFGGAVTVFTVVNVATGGANVVAPGVSVVIAGTASIITGAICFDQQLDQFNDTECPLCRETWVNQCCM